MGRLELLRHSVYSASNATEAIHFARLIEPNIIFVDLNLDDGPLSGVDLLCRLSEEPATASAVRIIHSVNVSLAQDALDAGLASGVLPKPYTKEQLHDLLSTRLV